MTALQYFLIKRKNPLSKYASSLISNLQTCLNYFLNVCLSRSLGADKFSPVSFEENIYVSTAFYSLWELWDFVDLFSSALLRPHFSVRKIVICKKAFLEHLLTSKIQK